jgi:hypothetical protein
VLHVDCIIYERVQPISLSSVPGFANDTDFSNMKSVNISIQLTDGIPIRSGYCSYLEVFTHRDMWTQ